MKTSSPRILIFGRIKGYFPLRWKIRFDATSVSGLQRKEEKKIATVTNSLVGRW